MNTTRRLTSATLSVAVVAAAAAVVMVQAPRAAVAPQADIVTLPRVEVIAKRAAPLEVVTLPAVHVTAKRAVAGTTLVAQKAARVDAL